MIFDKKLDLKIGQEKCGPPSVIDYVIGIKREKRRVSSGGSYEMLSGRGRCCCQSPYFSITLILAALAQVMANKIHALISHVDDVVRERRNICLCKGRKALLLES